MKALIDGDILLYQFGSLTDDQGKPLRWDLICNHLNDKIAEIVDMSGCSDYMIYLTGSGNFRKNIATIKPYKGSRKNLQKPHSYYKVKEYLLKSSWIKCTIVTGMEADDALGMNDGVRCSNDKDIEMIPGKHVGWSVGKRIPARPLYTITEEQANRNFFCQLLSGDPVDDILGLYMIGPKKAEKLLDGLTGALSMYAKVKSEYILRFGSYWQLFMHENARLLWIWRKQDDNVLDWFTELEAKLEVEEQEKILAEF